MAHKLRLLLAGLFAFSVACLIAKKLWMTELDNEAENDNDKGDDTKANHNAALSLNERVSMLHGSPSTCGWTGFVPGVPKKGIPELRMNDGPQGFRGDPGKSTAYPSALTVAATFNRSLAYDWGKEIAKEFKEKGANVLLGPGLNILRINENGRTFEYLSGEDPILGARLADAVIRGMQSVPQMIATAKHFVLNNQEKDRMTVDSIVDEQVFNELYLPPFKSAVDAGVLAIMCSYNKVAGKWACEQGKILNHKLRNEWGFQGFVMSDWGATHTTSLAIMSGLDQEMPGGEFFGDNLVQLAKSNSTIKAAVDRSSSRILYALKEANITVENTPGPCDIHKDVTSKERRDLARKWAIDGTILLKNVEDILPLKGTQTFRLAVFGAAANATNILSGGGSGHVDPAENGVSVLKGLSILFREKLGLPHENIVWEADPDVESLTHSLKNVAAAVIVIGTNAQEGEDRDNLSFGKGDELVERVAAAASLQKIPVIVICSIPGPVLVPWSGKVSAILLMPLLGQETGHAISSILFGFESPAGRLPFTIPSPSKMETFSPEQYPGVDLVANYSEGLLTGYRWYDYYKVPPMFPFGFGLTYAKFHYVSNAGVMLQQSGMLQKWYVDLHVENVGQRAGAETVQLYLFRERCTQSATHALKRPPSKLIDFAKVEIGPSDWVPVVLAFEFQDIAEWDSKHSRWVFPDPSCTYFLNVGSSSRDIKLQFPISFN